MTPHQILIVGIRLLAILWLLNVLARVPVILVTFEHAEMEPYPALVALGLQFAVSVVLWLFPSAFAGMLLRAGKTPVSASDTPLGDWYALCFIAVGVFMLARALPDLAYWVVLASKGEPLAEPFTLDQKAGFAATLVELAVGVGLMLGATGFSTLIHRLRRAGVPTGR